jgi:ornithine cyclodeaminase/alanine dehydrogenase-like protein (mu-crystallin family)
MLLLNNDDVERLLTIEECIDAIEEAYKDMGQGLAAQFPPEGRMDLGAPSPGPELGRRFTWGAMAAVWPRHSIFALRQKLDIHYRREHADGFVTIDKFAVAPGSYCGIVLLVSTANAEPLAFVNDGVLQHLRVAACGAVAGRYMAPEKSETLAIIGSGGMARTHAAAFCAIRPIKRIQVYSMTPANRERFAREMTSKLEIPVTAMDSAEAALANADVASFCTDSAVPILKHEDWMRPGMHITNVVSSEIGNATAKVGRIILHEHGGTVGTRALAEGEVEQSGSREGYGGLEKRLDLPTLTDLVTGKVQGRTSAEETTLFWNFPGSGMHFAAVGAVLYEKAKAQGAGQQIPTEWFLQNIRD